MKYHLMTSMEATTANWREMLHAFAAAPYRMDEGAIKCIWDAARSAHIVRNQRAEMLAFLDSCWDVRHGAEYGRPTFETSAPYDFRVIRKQWRMTVTLWYCDNSGIGSPKEGIHLTINSKDPEYVRRFAYQAAAHVGHDWCGSLHIEDNHSSAPEAAKHVSVDHAVDALIALAKEKAVTV